MHSSSIFISSSSLCGRWIFFHFGDQIRIADHLWRAIQVLAGNLIKGMSWQSRAIESLIYWLLTLAIYLIIFHKALNCVGLLNSSLASKVTVGSIQLQMGVHAV